MICPSLSQKKKTDGFDIIDTGAYNNNKKKTNRISFRQYACL